MGESLFKILYQVRIYLSILVMHLMLAIFAYSCGNDAGAEKGYERVLMFGHWCITNDVSIWCEQN